MFKKLLILFFILSFFFLGNFMPINAQLVSDDIIISANPKNPRNNQEVKISLSSRSVNLNQTKIFWFQNGQLIFSGIGRKEYVFNTGSEKNLIEIEANIETTGGIILNKKISIMPGDIDLLWEAVNSYTPPFYRGKALNSLEGSVKVVALPNYSETLGYSYKWKMDGSNKVNSSGYGKNFYLFKQSYLDKENFIEVSITDLFNKNIANENIVIKNYNPQILFYKIDPTLGTLWQESINYTLFLENESVSLKAEPYFFSNQNIESLSFTWFIDNQKIDRSDLKNILSLNKDPKSSGQAEIKLIIENLNTLLQKAEKKLNVNL